MKQRRKEIQMDEEEIRKSFATYNKIEEIKKTLDANIDRPLVNDFFIRSGEYIEIETFTMKNIKEKY